MALVDTLPEVSAESRRIAAERFDRAHQVAASGEFRICNSTPSNLLQALTRVAISLFRQTLRRTQKAKYKNNLRGSRLAFLTSVRLRAKVEIGQAWSRLRQGAGCRRAPSFKKSLGHPAPKWTWRRPQIRPKAYSITLSSCSIKPGRRTQKTQPSIRATLARLFERGALFRRQSLYGSNLVKEVAPDDVGGGSTRRKTLRPARQLLVAAYTGYWRKGHDGQWRRSAGRWADSAGSSAELTVEPPDRVSREAAPILARLDTNPTDPRRICTCNSPPFTGDGNQPDRARPC